ncbi:hypothetical protein B0H11DRAFT_1332622 [Mycena galericulata]|nr:hypothetical protein B0H11DRAFT_1332622 [Mycena galericulata]
MPHEQSPSENDNVDKLINAMNMGFKQLVEQNKEQADRLQRAVEALKPVVAATDSKTTFWNAYKTVADEYDKEFLQKWGTDLDTALIFAGLFSAVSSAFITQIQPQIQLHGTSTVIIVAQSILYASLGSTLLAALLAVLGKQWLMYYSAAGEKGSIESRGLERQRKLDGLRKWKFEAIMQMFPLLLQFGLFLFAAALSVYLWTVHISLGVVVLGLTFLGSTAYIALLVSAVVFPDSPFQTPLAPFIIQLMQTALWIRLKTVFNFLTTEFRKFMHPVWSACSGFVQSSQELLPHFSKSLPVENPGKNNDTSPLFDPLRLEPSPEVSAVAWVLETSTDPLMVSAAAGLAIHLQWPIGMNVKAQLVRLQDSFKMCFETVSSCHLSWASILHIAMCSQILELER